MFMKIAISGLSGCGNTTAVANVSKILKIPAINYTFRNLAADSNLTLEDIQQLAMKDKTIDYLVDSKIISIFEKNKNCVVGTRLASWLVPDADLRVWLHASPNERAKRIHAREKHKTLHQVRMETNRRDAENIARYKEYYKIDITKERMELDLVVNTERLTPGQVAALIVAAAKLATSNNLKRENPLSKQIKTIIARNLNRTKLQKLPVSIQKAIKK